MGSCSSRTSGQSDDLPRESCHEQHAPMWVVKVKDVLKMTGRLQPHQVLKEDGMLILRESLDGEVLVIFVSHQWLSGRHPDEKGEQLLVLQTILKKIHKGDIVVENDLVSQYHSKKRNRLSLSHSDRLLDAYVWFDYFSVPQVAHTTTVEREEQLSYIRSIPYYIDSCQVFVALTPSLKNESGNTCDYSSWLSRGWCRTEMWCKQLSDASDIPVIVVHSNETAHFVCPQWLRFPVPTADFAIEADRFHCCQVVQKSLERKLLKLRQKNLNEFRFFTARFEKMVGLQPKQRTLEQFWSDFALLPGAVQQKGLSPVACVTLAEDTDILRNLVVARASLETVAPDMTKLGIPPGFSPLHLAATFSSHNLHLLETLLELRANPNNCPPLTGTPLQCCQSAGAVELLVRHKADVNGKCSFVARLS